MRNYFNEIQEELTEEQVDLKWKIGSKVTFITETNFTPLFAYDYLDYNCMEYGTNSPQLSLFDFQKYFEKVTQLSKKTISSIRNHEKHFNIELASGKILDTIKKRFILDKLSVENTPSVGHFELYTSESKSPRIHFILGPLGVFYIFLFDTEHKIHLRK